MRNLGDTIGRLAARQAAAMAGGGSVGSSRLSDLGGFGANPGALGARTFVPAGLPSGAPLVVVLHGCTQTAADYDRGAGWSALAEEQGFALLFPEQVRTNNANLCFNWFVPGDISRGGGEALSIRNMIEAMAIAHGLDRRRIHITGLSAGGAMALAMLATYPEIFAGGAIIAGVPFGSAVTVPEAFDRMRGQGLPAPAALTARIRAASGHVGAWPTLSVWQGSADNTVDPANAEAIAAAWAHLTGAGAAQRAETAGGYTRRVWKDAQGSAAVEAIVIAGMGHGTPLATRGPEACGAAGPFMLDVGISSTRRIAADWGIAPAVAAGASASAPAAATGIEAMIDTALRHAGLIR
jgi:poly(hydroxyalkanoate) depolymerase family esterase